MASFDFQTSILAEITSQEMRNSSIFSFSIGSCVENPFFHTTPLN